MYFAKSNQVERYLDSVSADYKYRDSIAISKLNFDWANQNPCRPGRAILDVSLSYKERMEKGELAPPAIVAKMATGYCLLDGRQRVFASQELGSPVFAAYELISPSARLERIVALGANAALNGVRPPQEFLIDSAIKLMATDDITLTEAARIAGSTEATILNHVATLTVRNALLSKGIEPQLSNGSLAALEVFIGEPGVLATTYQAIEDASATVAMTELLVKDMAKQPGRGRMLVLDSWKKRPEIQARMARRYGRKMLAREAVFQSARSLRTVLKQRFEDIASELKESDKKELAKLGTYINGKIRQLTGEFSGVV